CATAKLGRVVNTESSRSKGNGARGLPARRECRRQQRVSAGAAGEGARASRRRQRRCGRYVRCERTGAGGGVAPRVSGAAQVRPGDRDRTGEAAHGPCAQRSLPRRYVLERLSRLGGAALWASEV